MDRALWLLIGFQLRGWLRSLVRRLRSVKGLLLALLGLSVLVGWFVSILIQPTDSLRPHRVNTYGPALLLVYRVINVLLSSGERAVYFSPAEITFLFTGPFGRRELLGYKVVLTLLYSLPSSLFLTLVMRSRSSWFLAVFIGLLLMTTFMQLFGMALSMGASVIGARLYSQARKVMVAAALLAGLFVLWLAPARGRGIDWIFDSSAWNVLLMPLHWFFDAALAQTWLGLLRYAALGILVNLFVVAVLFSLNVNYLEGAAAYSSRVYAQIQRWRGGRSYAETFPGQSRLAGRRRELPMPPNLHGVGPLTWRQLTTAARRPAAFFGLATMMMLWIAMMLSVAREIHVLAGVSQPHGAAPELVIGVGIVVLTVFITRLLPFDFRGDLDRLEILKTLPLAPWRLALGQILSPVIVLCLFQWTVLAVLVVVMYARGAGGPDPERNPLMLVGAAAAALPYNFLLFGVENVLFLLFPARLLVSTPSDFQAIGRNVLLFLAKVVMLVLVAVAMVPPLMLVYSTSGLQIWLMFAAAWVVLAASAATLVPVAGLAFTWVDVSRDQTS